MIKKDIAVTIQNFVQFQSLEYPIKQLLKNKHTVDIYVPVAKDPWGLDAMFDEIYKYLKEQGYKPKRKVSKNITYKVLLEPYPMDYYFSIPHEYRLKYKYAAITSKPNPCLKPEDNIYYDGIFCVSSYEEHYLSVYAKPYVVGNLKFCKFEYKNKTKKNKKPVLLYLPTYGNLNSINLCSDQLQRLKDKYYIITKSHHGTNYFDYEKNNVQMLKNLFDEFYESNKPLSELFERADVVLSDNSGSISEAIYAKVPVAIIAENINPGLENFNTFQYEFVEKGIIPYSSNPNDLEKVIDEALSNVVKVKQQQLSDDIFPVRGMDGVNVFVNVVESYLNDTIDSKYVALHRILAKEFKRLKEVEVNNYQLQQEKNVLNETIKNQENELKRLQEELSYYHNGKLYRLSKKIYTIKQGRKEEKNGK